MIRTLDRYLLGTFFATYLMSLGVLISLYVALDLFVNFDEFTEQGWQSGKVLWSVFDYYFFNLPLYFSQISGVITLFAACGTLVRLQRQNEITAILASGTSLYRVAAPIVVAALLTNFLVVVDYEVVLPKVAAKLSRERDDVDGSRVYDVWCIRDGKDRLLSAMRFSPKEEAIRNLIVMELSKNPATRGRLSSVLTADKAYWQSEEHGWQLERGVRIRRASDVAGGLSADSSIQREIVDFYASQLTPDELLLRQTAQWIRFLSVSQLSELERHGEVDPEATAQIKHSRFTMPINNMILLLIGITFFLSRLPEGILHQGAKALGTCAVVFLIAFVGQQFVGSVEAVGTTPFWQALPAWLPIFLFGPLAVVMLDKIKT
jgi:lipopolysaccharide export system permease protein